MQNSCKFKSPKSGDSLLALHYKNKTCELNRQQQQKQQQQ